MRLADISDILLQSLHAPALHAYLCPPRARARTHTHTHTHTHTDSAAMHRHISLPHNLASLLLREPTRASFAILSI